MPKKELTKDGKPRYKSLTVDAEIIGMLQDRAAEFIREFGFKPTISQTIRHILAKEKKS